ncbi:TIGR03087 family PEP-CTERM/XrtA system glycosyltransferase [Thalassoroseus pseudoceratinae]|uniref:TIGR03087 family PEP-CTERM/XrtA system glycosyltransferase n=1 Tax=Thalassoroseus pseudoceratinae TaxID=2713176 RepID=UPI001421550B|nr:TIGR03087 family PEP-CTERM/XrtA system glycosyltransferase [Thalassoroseus pseudoceratinae]
MADLLYMTHRVPYPPNRGDRIRTYHLLRHLAKDHRIHLACLADEPPSDETRAELDRLCERVAIVPVASKRRWLRGASSFLVGRTVTEGMFHEPKLHEVLRRWQAETVFDAALASSSALSPYLRALHRSAVPCVMDFIDVDSVKWQDYASESVGIKKWLYTREATRLRRVEQDVCGWAKSVTVVSTPEANLLTEMAPMANAHAVPNGVDVDFFTPQLKSEPQRCVFVGAMDYRPNVAGCLWFADHVWPSVLERYPEATFEIVGREPTAAIRNLEQQPGIHVVGTVPDVRPYLHRATVAVVPLSIARGVQNKVLEALAAGKAVIGSPSPVVGLGVEPGVHLLKAETPNEWATAISRVFDDPTLREELGSAGREFVMMHHRWETCLEPMSRLIDDAIPTSSPSATEMALPAQL